MLENPSYIMILKGYLITIRVDFMLKPANIIFEETKRPK